MIFHALRRGRRGGRVDRFLQSRERARGVVTVGKDVTPHVAPYLLGYEVNTPDLQVVRTDEQIQDLRSRPRRAAKVDEAREEFRQKV